MKNNKVEAKISETIKTQNPYLSHFEFEENLVTEKEREVQLKAMKLVKMKNKIITVSDRLRRGPCRRFLPELDASCLLIFSKLVFVSASPCTIQKPKQSNKLLKDTYYIYYY